MKIHRNKFILNFAVVLLINLEATNAYKRMILEDHLLCSPNTKRKISLGKGYESAMLVTQTRLSDHRIDWTADFFCKFEVHSKIGNGIFAVIQNLIMRKNATTNECIDHIQFKRHDGTMSRKFCGIINAKLVMDKSSPTFPIREVLPDNSYIDEKGALDVRIFISRKALLPHEDTDLVLALTTFRNFICIFGKDEYEPCGGQHNTSCIYKYFIKDGVFNCPYYNCVDESGCDTEDMRQIKEPIGNKVLIASLTSLLVTFVLFIGCLWVCRVHKIMCWSENFANSSNHNTSGNTSAARPQQFELSQQVQNPPTTADPTLAEDKDLPPSYDSLFPSR